MSFRFLKRRTLLGGALLFGAAVAIPAFAYLSLGEVRELSFDGRSRQIGQLSLFRSDAARKNFVDVYFPPLAAGDNVFDLATELAQATSTKESENGKRPRHAGLRVEILQHRQSVTDPYPYCTPDPKPERTWKGIAGKVTLTFRPGAKWATRGWHADRGPKEEPLELGWVSGRIENLEVRVDANGGTQRLNDIEIPPTRMMAGPFAG